MSNRCRAVFVLLTLFLAGQLGAQSQRTAHTYKLDQSSDRPAATLNDVAWLVGSWSGEAFGGTFEAVWNPASAGSMVGLFKLLQKNEVEFYEILLLVEEQGSLSLKVKHFSKDFHAWETKEEYVNFRLVKIEKDAIHFSGLSFYRKSDDDIDAFIVFRHGDKISEEKLVYKRVP